jgi:hypothetical protein
LQLPQPFEAYPPAGKKEMDVGILLQQPRRLEHDLRIMGKAEIA